MTSTDVIFLIILALSNCACPIAGLLFVKKIGFTMSAFSLPVTVLLSLIFGFFTLVVLVLTLILLPFWIKNFVAIEFNDLLLIAAISFVAGAIIISCRMIKEIKHLASKSEDHQ